MLFGKNYDQIFGIICKITNNHIIRSSRNDSKILPKASNVGGHTCPHKKANEGKQDLKSREV